MKSSRCIWLSFRSWLLSCRPVHRSLLHGYFVVGRKAAWLPWGKPSRSWDQSSRSCRNRSGKVLWLSCWIVGRRWCLWAYWDLRSCTLFSFPGSTFQDLPTYNGRRRYWQHRSFLLRLESYRPLVHVSSYPHYWHWNQPLWNFSVRWTDKCQRIAESSIPSLGPLLWRLFWTLEGKFASLLLKWKGIGEG